jgi:hypothetical protein
MPPPAQEDGPVLHRFPPRRGRSIVGTIIALVAFIGSLVAAAAGPAPGETIRHPLLVLLMLIRG